MFHGRGRWNPHIIHYDGRTVLWVISSSKYASSYLLLLWSWSQQHHRSGHINGPHTSITIITNLIKLFTLQMWSQAWQSQAHLILGWVFQSRKRLYIRQCPFVCLYVCLQNPSTQLKITFVTPSSLPSPTPSSPSSPTPSSPSSPPPPPPLPPPSPSSFVF